jgi:hypothetical protein
VQETNLNLSITNSITQRAFKGGSNVRGCKFLISQKAGEGEADQIGVIFKASASIDEVHIEVNQSAGGKEAKQIGVAVVE